MMRGSQRPAPWRRRYITLLRHLAGRLLGVILATVIFAWGLRVPVLEAAGMQGVESPEPLSEREYDPTASLSQFQIKDLYTPAEYGTNAQSNTFQVRAILAVEPSWLIPFPQLIRPTFKLDSTPNGKGAPMTTAYDDMQLLDLLVMPWPGRESGFRWGVGPYVVFPTATSKLVGNGAWQMGPAAAFSYRGVPGLNIAGLIQQATSFAYTSSRSQPVNSLSFQPIVTYQLGNEWYLKSSDATWTFNLRQNTSTEMPLSAGFGRVWTIAAGYAVDTSVSGEWTLYRQFATRTEQFTINFNLNLLLPTVKL